MFSVAQINAYYEEAKKHDADHDHDVGVEDVLKIVNEKIRKYLNNKFKVKN